VIGGRIKAMLDGKGLSQRELARRIGKHPSEISVEKIAAGLGVSVAELVGQPGEIPVCEQLRAEIGEGGMWELLEWIRKIKRPPG